MLKTLRSASSRVCNPHAICWLARGAGEAWRQHTRHEDQLLLSSSLCCVVHCRKVPLHLRSRGCAVGTIFDAEPDETVQLQQHEFRERASLARFDHRFTHGNHCLSHLASLLNIRLLLPPVLDTLHGSWQVIPRPLLVRQRWLQAACRLHQHGPN